MEGALYKLAVPTKYGIRHTFTFHDMSEQKSTGERQIYDLKTFSRGRILFVYSLPRVSALRYNINENAT